MTAARVAGGGDPGERRSRAAREPLEVLRLYREHDYTLAGAFRSRLARDPDRPFLLCQGRTWSWGEFAGGVEATARWLVARGVGKGDRIAIVARNGEGHLRLLFAAARIGAILVPVNPDLGADDARYVLHHADVRGVAVSRESRGLVDQACQGLAPAPWCVVLDAGTSGERPPGEATADAAGVPLPGDVTADDTCLIVYTSGTTGFPKGVMHSQRSFVTCGEASVQRLHLQDDDRVMIVLPLFHVNALFYSVAGALAAGCSLVVVPRFSASRFWSTAVETGATTVNIIEAIGTILANRPRSEFRPDHGIRAVYGVRRGVVDVFRRDFGVPHLIGGYGMTEIPGVTCNPFDGVQKPESMGPVGRHPDPRRPWAECRVVDDEGREVPDGAIGELVVRTPIVMQGYFRDPEQTAAAFRDGWFLTGDLVRRDEDGYFHFVARKKDIIRRRGENIAGAELDRVCGAHPAVQEAAAIAVPSELGEDEILVAVVPKPGRTVTAEEVAQWCRERLAAFKVPRFVAIVDALPHTPTHKIAKALLRADPTLRPRAVDLAPPAGPAPGGGRARATPGPAGAPDRRPRGGTAAARDEAPAGGGAGTTGTREGAGARRGGDHRGRGGQGEA
jgi:crotonobetaine/carnitine-CoA ligase